MHQASIRAIRKPARLTLLTACLLAVANCTGLPPTSEVSVGVDSLERTVSIGGVDRTFLLGGQTDGSAKTALVILHGGRGNAESAKENFQFESLAQREGILTIYPDAIGEGPTMVGGEWNDGRRFADADRETRSRLLRPDDVGFLSALPDLLASRHGVDRQRVFLVGVSNGGMMTLRIACEAPETFAGFATVIANFPEGMAVNCDPTVLRPMIFIHGTQDRLMPYEGGPVVPMGAEDRGRVSGTEETIEWWVRRAGCSGDGAKTEFGEPGGATRTHRTRWTECQGGAARSAYKVVGGGHRWSNDTREGRLAQLAGVSTTDVAYEEAIWSFFRLLIVWRRLIANRLKVCGHCSPHTEDRAE